jgi:outer membrane protein assembly factor BamB
MHRSRIHTLGPQTFLVLTACLAAMAGESPARPDPYRDQYRRYEPDFLDQIAEGDHYGGQFRGWQRPEKQMRLSSEPSFFTLNMIHEDARANALVLAAREKELAGQYLEALKMYQIVIDRYPHQLYRVSKFGVFVPVAQYCQRRILNLPASARSHYRTLHDARAGEAFESARRKHSLIGLSEIVDHMFATSYGGRAVLELGNASLDSGHFLAALERFNTVRRFFPDPALQTIELDLKVAYCRKMLGETPGLSSDRKESELSSEDRDRLRRMIEAATYETPPFHSQRSSAPHAAADDYTLFPPTRDPLAVQPPVWRHRLPGSRRDYYVYTQPVVTDNSVVYRHKNIIYCRSLLTGEMRWENDLGGRAAWQNWDERQYPQERVLVQDGLVFTVVSKGGPSLVALDEVTGQLKWAYGPMVAGTEEEARMRFETAPAGGPMTVYAGYVLDNIEGETHTDTEYGLMAFESTTGRLRWRRRLCRLAPGKFAAGFAERRRNRIRSFVSPPLYHQGTVYHTTNAGAVVAVEALSGRVKWLARYPYHPHVHDATRQFGRGGDIVRHGIIRFRPHSPMFWYNQRPLVVGERLYVLPVDTPFLLCIDRRSGKVLWSKPKGTIGTAYLLGPIASGDLVFVYTGRRKKIRGTNSPAPVQLVDPETGKTTWQSADLVALDEHPVMKYWGRVSRYVVFGMGANTRWWYENAARPFLSRDGRLYVSSFFYWGYPLFGHATNLGVVSLPDRKIVDRRHYYGGELLAAATRQIHSICPKNVKNLEELPHKDDRIKWLIKIGKAIAADTVPVNEHGPFMPFSRLTARRYGALFELRMDARNVEMLYDRDAVRASVGDRADPAAEFVRAELDLADSRLDEACRRLRHCLRIVSSEDLDFRALVRQQLFRVHKRLTRSAIRATSPERELEHALGMNRTAGTLEQEVEALFALADAYERAGQLAAAARCLRSIAGTYGRHEYPVAPVAVVETRRPLETAENILDRASAFARNEFYGPEFQQSLALVKRGLPLYLSTVSPLPRPLTVRAGELATARLIELQAQSDEFAHTFERTAATQLTGRPPEEQHYRLWEFPGTQAGQTVVAKLFADAAKTAGPAGRRRMWELADAARVSGLAVPDAFQARVLAPPPPGAEPALALPPQQREKDLAEAEGINWLVLERRGDRTAHPNLFFLGGRVRKRLDNKFILACFDLETGEKVWEKRRIRLKGKGQEPGFFDAFVHGDLVVVHGLYDVLAFDVNTAELRWRARVPFDFEIKHSLMSGDLLVLAGKSETIALYVPTASPAGEVVWQMKERGDLYIPPYFHGDRLISLRKMPFNVTVRFRATGTLVGRLHLPDLSMFPEHPLLEEGPEALPAATDGGRLAVTDGWYYILVDVERMQVLWKRLIDNNDLTREPAMRFALNGDYFAVLKEDYDQKVIYMLSSRTGRVLWQTDPKDADSPRPMHSMLIDGDRIYGIGVHPGQGFYFVARDCRTGTQQFRRLVEGYDARPKVRLVPRLYGTAHGRHAAVTVQDRKVFELRLFDTKTGKPVHTLRKKGVGPFGVHGRVSTTVQNGRAVLLSKDNLDL